MRSFGGLLISRRWQQKTLNQKVMNLIKNNQRKSKNCDAGYNQTFLVKELPFQFLTRCSGTRGNAPKVSMLAIGREYQLELTREDMIQLQSRIAEVLAD